MTVNRAARRYRIAQGAALVSAIVLLLSLVLYVRSFHGNSQPYVIGGIGRTELQFTSWQGRMMIGVFERHEPSRIWWWRQPQPQGLARLVMSQEYGVLDFRGWGLAVPYAVIALLAAVPIAWWLFVMRDHRERQARASKGLCVECGSDLSGARGLCPTCGAPTLAL
jgi:hypothetical protein